MTNPQAIETYQGINVSETKWQPPTRLLPEGLNTYLYPNLNFKQNKMREIKPEQG